MTLVELLVTIIVAGFAFAALIPLFVYASQTSAGDNARTVALGIAQDKMERIRSLPYDEVLLANLNDSTYATAHGLGNQASATTGSGGKIFLVDYEVEYIYDPDSAYKEPGLELYKLVTVDVYWEGNPRPVKHVRLRTSIYRQYAGPVILGIEVSPRSDREDLTKGMIVPAEDRLVTITARTLTGQVAKEVRFTLSSGNGAYSLTYTQKVGTSGAYVWQWDAQDAPDGFYTITATALSSGGYLGNTWRVVEQLETGSPPPPGGLTATPGDGSVALDWQKPAAGDIKHYEVWRSDTPDRDDAQELTSDLQATHYPDTAVTNDVTYYYWVYAVDLVDLSSDPALADATPSVSAGDRIAPTAPILAATVQSTTITLTWAASQDPPPPDPPSGVAYYEIFRSTDGINYTSLDATPTLSYADPVGAGSPAFWYMIRAVDANENRSTFSAPVGPLQTPPAPRTLTVFNDRSSANGSCTVTVYDPVSRLYYDQNGTAAATPPPAVSIGPKGGSAIWHDLPGDKVYRVTATYTTGNPRTTSQTAPPWTIRFN